MTDGLTPVHWGCVFALDEIVTVLLEHVEGVVSASSRQQMSPLHIAASVGHLELCAQLIESGAKVISSIC